MISVSGDGVCPCCVHSKMEILNVSCGMATVMLAVHCLVTTLPAGMPMVKGER